MKNDLTTGTWQDDIWCPIIIILLCTSDVSAILYGNDTALLHIDLKKDECINDVHVDIQESVNSWGNFLAEHMFLIHHLFQLVWLGIEIYG